MYLLLKLFLVFEKQIPQSISNVLITLVINLFLRTIHNARNL